MAASSLRQRLGKNAGVAAVAVAVTLLSFQPTRPGQVSDTFQSGGRPVELMAPNGAPINASCAAGEAIMEAQTPVICAASDAALAWQQITSPAAIPPDSIRLLQVQPAIPSN